MAFNDANTIKTLMGWNQTVLIDYGFGFKILRITDYDMGTKQNPNVPDYVTGRQDRTAFTKGPVEIDGSFSYPLTFESGTGTCPGITMFKLGALLCSQPQNSFLIKSSAGEELSGCKVNTTSISCTQGGGIECQSTIMGISTSKTNNSFTTASRVVSDDLGFPDGYGVSEQFTTVQIPMWDACQVIGAPPGMIIIGFKVQIDNKLQRNYSLGNDESASPWGLNATSISAKQRTVSGSVTWQSNEEGFIHSIIGAGLSSLIIRIKTDGNEANDIVLNMNECVWSATPPKLSAGDKVTIESNFTALGTGLVDFDALLITPEGI